jgi:hypothetical protein
MASDAPSTRPDLVGHVDGGFGVVADTFLRNFTDHGEVGAALCIHVRHSDGFRMREPRPLDAELLIAAAEEATGLGLLRLRLDGRPVDLDELISPADHGELVAILERSVVASAS